MNLRPIAGENDEVILFTSHDELTRVTLACGTITQCRAGKFHHDDIIGQQFGTRIFDRKDTKRSMVVLPVSPEWRTLSIKHRTQVVYSTDLAMVHALLDCRAGSIILESGTGSGSATVSFARTVGPHGHVYTFEYHNDRFREAQREFEELGIEKTVTCFNRDVYVDGFGLIEGQGGVPEDSIEGAFLDLPQPWLAIGHADKVLKGHSKLVIFSPCNEQLQQSAAVLRDLKYQDIEAFEVLCKPWGVWTESDALRKIRRTDAAREANVKAGRTTKEFTKIVVEKNSIFEVCPQTFYQTQMRGHTGYMLVGMKPPKKIESRNIPGGQ